MNVIVVGCGRVGLPVGDDAVGRGTQRRRSSTRTATPFRASAPRSTASPSAGSGFDEDVLEEAGIREADAFAAVTDLDNTNLMAAEVARKLFGVKHVVARLYNPSARAHLPAARPRLRVRHDARGRAAPRQDQGRATVTTSTPSATSRSSSSGFATASAGKRRPRDVHRGGRCCPRSSRPRRPHVHPDRSTRCSKPGDVMRRRREGRGVHKLERFMEE